MDLASTVPFDDVIAYLLKGFNGNLISIRLIRILRIMKLIKFFRVVKLKKIFELLENIDISPAIVSIIVLVIEIFFIAHVLGCLWYYITTSDSGADPQDNWVHQNFMDDSDVFDIYIASYYYVITTMVTIGYGDFHAVSAREQLFSCLVILGGVIMFGAVITKVTKLIIFRNPQANKYKALLDDLKGYMTENNFPDRMKTAAIDSYLFYMQKKSLIGESGLLEELPKPMLIKLVQSMYKQEIQTIQIFKKFESSFIIQMVINFQPFQVRSGEIISNIGDIATDIYFIMRGSVQLATYEGSKLAVCGKCSMGHYFGDFEFFKPTTRIAQYQAKTSCNLLSINNLIMSQLLSDYLDCGIAFVREIESRYNLFNQIIRLPVVLFTNGAYGRKEIFLDGVRKSFNILRLHDEEVETFVSPRTIYRVSRLDCKGTQEFAEEDKDDIGRRNIVMNNGKLKTRWDLYIGLLIIYSVTAIPIEIAFSTEPSNAMYVFEICLDLSFFLDILITFRTAYYDTNHDYTETIPHNIYVRYLRSWFLIDLISTIPFDKITSATLSSSSSSNLSSLRILKFVRLSRLFKMFRISKLMKYLHKLETAFGISPAVYELIKYMIMLLLMAHLCACFFWFACTETTNTPWYTSPEKGVYHFGYETENYDLNRKYVAALYFMLVTLTTVGYGDIVIITLQERIINIFVMIIGTTVFGYLIASVSSLVGSLNRTAALQQDRISEISAYLHERKCPKPLVKSIMKYFNHIFELKTAYDESAILSRLPMNLKNEILYFKNAESIIRIPLLHHLENHSVILYIFEKLVFAYYEPESVIINEGSPVSGIYFLTSGKALITKATSDIELERYQKTYKDLRTTILFSKKSSLDRFNNLNKMINERNKEKAKEKTKAKAKVTKNFLFNFHFRKNPVAVTAEVSSSNKIKSFKSHSDLFEEEISKIGNHLNPTHFIPNKTAKVEPSPTEEFMSAMKNDSVVLGELHAGQFIGHTAFMNQTVQSVSAEALTACTFYILNKNTFQNILIEQPCIALNLQIALAKSIAELKNISGKHNIWEKKNHFVKALHVTHINVKKKKIDFNSKKTILQVKHKRKSSLATFKLDLQKLPKAKNIKRSLKDLGGDYKNVAQAHWDFIRHLIKATARQSIVAVAAGSKFDPNNTPSKPMAQKAIYDPLKQQRNKIAAFSRNLKLRIGLELGRMIDSLLKIDEDELDNQHTNTSIKHNFKRVKSLPHIPSDNYHLKTFDSLKSKKFRVLKRRQSFPSTDLHIWENDYKSRNIF